MITNDGRILSNVCSGTTFTFVAQINDWYIGSNGCNSQIIRMTASGVTVNDPINVYYQKPFETDKCKITTDITNCQLYFTPTYENSVKRYYFNENLEAISALRFFGYDYCWSGTYYTGDLIKAMGQFPNIKSFEIAGDDWACDYIGSFFNQDISFTSFPNQIQRFTISDSSLSGDIETVSNFDSIQCLRLNSVGLTGSLSNVLQGNLKDLSLWNVYSLGGDLADLSANNPNFSKIRLGQTPTISGCATDWNVSGFTSMCLQIYNSYNINGDLSNWKFNTGLTTFCLYNNSIIDGDLTNWDFSNTQLIELSMQNYQYTNPVLYGSLSGWTFPNTIQSIRIDYLTGLTSFVEDFSLNTSLTCLETYYLPKVSMNIANILLPSGVTTYYNGYTGTYGDIGQFTVPPNMVNLDISFTCISGNISGFTYNTGLTSCMNNMYITCNPYLTGDIAKFPIASSLDYLYFYGNSGLTFNLTAPFNTKNLYQINLTGIGCVSGDLSNFIVGSSTSLESFSISCASGNTDLSKLDYNKIDYVDAACVCGLYGDLTNWFTGTTHCTCGINIQCNPLISGNTGGWNVDGFSSFVVHCTSLSGALKHASPYWFCINNTAISSTLPDDINFSSAYWVNMECTNVQGWLTGLTINYGIYHFATSYSPNLYGSNEFIDYLFVNRRNWNYPYTYWGIYCIGDRVLPTGGTETTGDTGTWSSCIWDLSEDQVNNLVDGLDYDGMGSNTPWTPREKIWWWRYAEASSVNPTKRYCNVNIGYS